HYIWPLAVIVFSNTLYQICAKGIPPQMNTYASMTVTYGVATLFSALAFFVTSKGGNRPLPGGTLAYQQVACF
ncbi:MAG: hypothetical protein IJ727_01480, partial [Treponema sp.]|nr:hypothetical protein [Treponema sp.]